MEKIKPIPIGVEFYKEMIDKGYYYVDKTLLIRDLLEQKNKVTLFTRPRRFGKTLAQTMLRTFFEEEIMPILLTLFHTIETVGTMSSSFYKIRVTLIPKPHED